MVVNSRRSIRFGIHEVDLTSEELRSRGTVVPLQGVPFRVLVALLERSGEVVTREELYKTLWQGSTFVAFEDNLNTAVRKIRLALRDSATNPRFIETLPRRGYRFLAPVEKVFEGHAPTDESAEAIPAKTTVAPPKQHRGLHKWHLAAAVALLAIAIASAGTRRFQESRQREEAQQYVLTRLTHDSGLTYQPSLSADGSLMAFASDRAGQGNLDIWIQPVDGGVPIQLTQEPANESTPVMSPDGRSVAFRSERDGGGIYVVPAAGGTPRLIAAGGRDPRYSPDSRRLAFWAGRWSGGELTVVEVSTGQAKHIETGTGRAMRPIWSPDGKHLLFLADREWWVIPAPGGQAVRTGVLNSLAAAGWSIDIPGVPPEAWISEDNAIVFSARMQETTKVWRIPLSRRNWRVAGPPEQLIFGTGSESYASFSGGRFVFASLNEKIDLWKLRVSGNGASTEVPPVRLTRDVALKGYPDVSADGRWLVYRSDRLRNEDIWIKDMLSGAESALTTTPAQESYPAISKDGTQVAYSAFENGDWSIYRLRLSGGSPVLICQNCGVTNDLSAAGRYVLSVRYPEWAISLVDTETKRETVLLRRPGVRVTGGQWSSDGNWIAFSETGDWERRLLIARFRGEAEIAPAEWIEVATGVDIVGKPNWSPDGDRIYFMSHRDGHRCIWSRRLDPLTKHPIGDFHEVQHFHQAHLSLSNMLHPRPILLPVAGGNMVVPLGEVSGNIWLASPGK